MSSLIKPVKGVTYTPDRVGYIRAVSRQECDSDLRYSYGYIGKNKEGIKVNNPFSVSRFNAFNYVGLFQFSEIALRDVGCYKKDDTPNPTHQDWGGKGNYWTGKYGATSLKVFANSGEIQMQAIQYWINRLCGYMRNINANEFYGKTIPKANGLNAFEVTESGVIAARHLKGDDAVLDFLTSNGTVNDVDGMGTSVGKYMSLFGHYDLETCCNRKIYIKIVDASNKPIYNISVKISSNYAGKFNVGEIVVTHKTNKLGCLPVIVRHPDAIIQLEIDGMVVESFTQKKDEKQKYEITYLGDRKFTTVLNEHETSDTTSIDETEIQNDQNPDSGTDASGENNIIDKEIEVAKFNIKLVEADTGKPLSNQTYYLNYKNNIKSHRTDESGVDLNIRADICESIGFLLDDDNGKQPIDELAFGVTEELNGQTKVIKIPVVSFNVKFVDVKGIALPLCKFKTLYRGRESELKTANSLGIYKIKALAGQKITFIDENGSSSVSVIVTHGAKNWKLIIGNNIVEEDIKRILDNNVTNKETTGENDSLVKQDNIDTPALEIEKPQVIETEKIKEDGPTLEVKSTEASLVIRFIDEATNQPLSGLTYYTVSTEYGKNSSVTGNDGTRGRPHESLIGVEIKVLVYEDGKEVEKGRFTVSHDRDEPYVYKAKKPKNYLFPLPIDATADYKSGMRSFGSNRSSGTRKHAGADLYAPTGTTVRAMESGIVLSTGSFYAGTDFVTIKHPNHIIRYGELAPGSIKVEAEDEVTRGQPIGAVGKLKGINVPSNMLHLEMYSNTNDTSKLTIKGTAGGKFKRRSDLINPNSFLDNADK